MPYSRRRRFARRRPLRRNRRAVRPRYRNRRVSRRSRGMSRRRILNITSIKKKDNMLPGILGADGTITSGTLSTSVGFVSLYCPSARILGTTAGAVAGESQRERQIVYARGYKERGTFTTPGGSSWRWRRIVFARKDVFPNVVDSGLVVDRYVRLVSNLNPSQQSQVYDTVFDGRQNFDWIDPQAAKVDTQRVTLIRDTTFTVNPGNETGNTRTMNNWYPINKTIIYDDDENYAPSAGGSPYSSDAVAGYGNVFILDIVGRLTGGATGNAVWSTEGTFYWHER